MTELCSVSINEVKENLGLHFGSIFIMGVTSLCATIFPILSKRVPSLNINEIFFNFAKYFGSGVIISTAFIHLLAPAIEELGNSCLNKNFQNYPFALAFSMIAIFLIFFIELISFRIGETFLKRFSKVFQQKEQDDDDVAGHHQNHQNNETNSSKQEKDFDFLTSQSLSTTKEESNSMSEKTSVSLQDQSSSIEKQQEQKENLSAATSEILGVIILEFGVIFHSMIIGITLGTMSGSKFKTLLIVLIFHQSFEGLGLGTRLALLPLKRTSLIPWIGAFAYSFMTPIGIAIGLSIRSTYDSNSATANYITGTFDSISSGILLYTGLVELLAHEFIFNEKMRVAPLSKVLLSISEIFLGAGLMALLGYWA